MILNFFKEIVFTAFFAAIILSNSLSGQTSTVFFKNIDNPKLLGITKTNNQIFFETSNLQSLVFKVKGLKLDPEVSAKTKAETLNIVFKVKNEKSKTIDSVFVNLENNSGKFSLESFEYPFKIQKGGQHKILIDFDKKSKLNQFLIEVEKVSINMQGASTELAFSDTWFLKNNTSNALEIPVKLETPLKGKSGNYYYSFFKFPIESNQINAFNIQNTGNPAQPIRAYILNNEELKKETFSSPTSNLELISFLKSKNQVAIGASLISNEFFSVDAVCKVDDQNILKQTKNLFSNNGDTLFYWDFKVDTTTGFPVNYSLMFDYSLKEIPVKFSFLKPNNSLEIFNVPNFQFKTGKIITEDEPFANNTSNSLKKEEVDLFHVFLKTSTLSFGNKIEVLSDFDFDGILDINDEDADNDGISNTDEFFGVNPFGDVNNNGAPNYIDPTFKHPKMGKYQDLNLDGINDLIDVDKDGQPNFVDLDSDNDGILDVVESGNIDSDENGFLDGISVINKPLDYDKDQKFDFLDFDSDDDGIPDLHEGLGTEGYQKFMKVSSNLFIDYNNNGILDYFDIKEGGKPVTPADENKNGIKDYLEAQPDGIQFDFNGCTAEMYFENSNLPCESELASYQCVEVDLTESLDPNGKELEFLWKWGDGTNSKGVKQRHCYKTQGSYKIFLDVINPKTKQLLSQSEFETEVSVRNSISLSIAGKSNFSEREIATFSPILNIPPHYKIDKVYWNYANKKYDCNPTFSTRVFNPGNYDITCVVFFSSGNDFKSLCFTKNITVTK